jgi:hypothetical protein
MKGRGKYIEKALQMPTAKAAFNHIVKSQHAEVIRREQRKQWANEKKTARRKGRL